MPEERRPLKDVLQEPLFQERTQFTKTKPSTKALTNFFTPFRPQLSDANTEHSFFGAYGDRVVPAELSFQTTLEFSGKTSVQAACDTLLVQWIASCLQNMGGTRTINVLRESQGIPAVFLRHQGHLPDVRVDFAFIHGHNIEDDRVAAVLQTKTVGSLKPNFWRGIIMKDPASLRISQEARAYALLFHTSLVLFFDGLTLVQLRFTGNPLNTIPEVWMVERGLEGQNSMRRIVFHAICQGLDMKQPGWINV